MAFKMKGNPMQRNFGIGSPLHHDQPRKIKYNKDGSIKKIKYQKHTHGPDNPDPDKKTETETKPVTPVEPEIIEKPEKVDTPEKEVMKKRAYNTPEGNPTCNGKADSYNKKHKLCQYQETTTQKKEKDDGPGPKEPKGKNVKDLLKRIWPHKKEKGE